jgi:hypothetical protein
VTAPVIRHLITRYGLCPNERNETGQTPLHLAISGKTSLYWIEGGSLEANVSPKNAARTRSSVAALLKLKAYVDSLDNMRCTPLVYAVREGAVGIVRLLMRHGADPALRDANGFTAFDHARLGSRVRDPHHAAMLDALGLARLTMRLRPPPGSDGGQAKKKGAAFSTLVSPPR